ncbi:MAG: class I SAM-dependent methyltransferase [Gemmatimonadota bacterium]|jgi:2-polyprenyl-3-methyl-5-hydroxy-6-metoxy-1,4-benzoquinol methylase
MSSGGSTNADRPVRRSFYETEDVRYDLELLLGLNEEYRDRKLVTESPSYEPEALRSRGLERAQDLHRRFNVKGKRVLEIGCGLGGTAHALAASYDCEVVGVDLEIDRSFGLDGTQLAAWHAERELPNLSLRALDISTEDHSGLGQFDLIYSYTVWEHMVHPFSALKAAGHLLRRDGCKYMITNLYRGPKASHLYREIFFPWPHLLFTDSVFMEFYDKYHPDAYLRCPPYVNKLTAAHYLMYFETLDFHVEDISYQSTPIDEDFYHRFHDLLSRYPRFDLEQDFLHVTLTHRAARHSVGAARRRLAAGRQSVRRRLAGVKALRWMYDRLRGR